MPLGRPFRRLALCTVATTTVFVACETLSTGPLIQTLDTLDVVLRSPNGTEGAAIIDLSGQGLLGVIEDLPFTIAGADDSGIRVAIILTEPGEITFTITVENVDDPPTAAVVEVADGNNELRASLAGYTVEFIAR